MQTITLAEAQARLPEVIDSLVAEKQIVITRDDQIIAVLLPKQAIDLSNTAQPPVPANRETESPRSARRVLDLKTFSVGKVLIPEFNREEVWDKMISREE